MTACGSEPGALRHATALERQRPIYAAIAYRQRMLSSAPGLLGHNPESLCLLGPNLWTNPAAIGCKHRIRRRPAPERQNKNTPRDFGMGEGDGKRASVAWFSRRSVPACTTVAQLGEWGRRMVPMPRPSDYAALQSPRFPNEPGDPPLPIFENIPFTLTSPSIL